VWTIEVATGVDLSKIFEGKPKYWGKRVAITDERVLGQNDRGQNGTDKMAPIESINQAIQISLTI